MSVVTVAHSIVWLAIIIRYDDRYTAGYTLRYTDSL